MTDKMVTRCPHCRTAFRIYQHQIEQRRGTVRCGACGGIFDAREHLSMRSSTLPTPVAPATAAAGAAGPTGATTGASAAGRPAPAVQARVADPPPPTAAVTATATAMATAAGTTGATTGASAAGRPAPGVQARASDLLSPTAPADAAGFRAAPGVKESVTDVAPQAVPASARAAESPRSVEQEALSSQRVSPTPADDRRAEGMPDRRTEVRAWAHDRRAEAHDRRAEAHGADRRPEAQGPDRRTEVHGPDRRGEVRGPDRRTGAHGSERRTSDAPGPELKARTAARSGHALAGETRSTQLFDRAGQEAKPQVSNAVAGSVEAETVVPDEWHWLAVEEASAVRPASAEAGPAAEARPQHVHGDAVETNAFAPAVESHDAPPRIEQRADVPVKVYQAERVEKPRRPRVRPRLEDFGFGESFLPREHLFAYSAATVLLALALLLQIALWFRSDLAGRFPTTRGLLTELCRPLSCDVVLPQVIDDLVIDASDLRSEEGVLTLTATLRNRGSMMLALPVIELTITSERGETVALRRLLPADYLGARAQSLEGIAAHGELSISVNIDGSQLAASGYRLLVLYV